MLQCCVCLSSSLVVCTECIVAKRRASYKSKSYYWSHIWEIDWYQNEWPWTLFRGRIKVMSTIASHSPLNISVTVKDGGLVLKDQNKKWHMGYQISYNGCTISYDSLTCQALICAMPGILITCPFASHFLHLLQFPADYHVILISGSVMQKPNEHCKIPHYDTSKHKKTFSFLGLRPPNLWPGTLPLDPAGGSAPDPHYRLALPRSPYLCAPLKFLLAPRPEVLAPALYCPCVILK